MLYNVKKIVITSKKLDATPKNMTVCVHRPYTLGNPYSTKASKFDVFKTSSTAESISMYSEWLRESIEKQDTKIIKELRRCKKILDTHNKLYLECFCKSEITNEGSAICHADVIRDALNDSSVTQLLSYNIK